MKDKKIYIRDIKENEKLLKKLLENNEKLRDAIFENYYTLRMDLQAGEFDLMFGKNWASYIDVKDNYNSFYLKLKDSYEFFKNLDSDYLNDEAKKIYKELSKKFEKIECFNINNEDDSKKYDDLTEDFENQCSELLEVCENQLHEFENIDENDLFSYFLENIQEQGYFINLYYYEAKNDFVLYEDISYTKSWK